MSKMKESKAMQEVREWKAECDAEVAHLSDREAVRKLLADSAKIAERLGYKYAPRTANPPSRVAEAPANYSPQSDKD